MIAEDYVSFEVAKLLKEKGFPQEYDVYHSMIYNEEDYEDKYEVQRMVFRNQTCKSWNIEVPEPKCYCPTYQMAMKWLREVHNIMVSPYALSLGYYFEIFDLTTRDITGCKPLYQVGIPSKEHVLSTYEEAAEAALKYALENLV